MRISCSDLLFQASLLCGKAIVTFLASYVIQKQEIKSKTEMVFLKLISQTEIFVLI